MKYAFKMMAVVLALGVLTKVDFAIANNEKQTVKSNLPSCPKSPPFINCYGFYKWANGYKYIGEWKDNKKHGQGTHTWANGDKYIGEWKGNKRHGQGTLTWKKGDKYLGEWKDSERNGQGTYTWANGDKYIGEYKDSKRNGQGKVTWKNGDKYVGEWKDSKRTGQGTYTWANGNKYVGEFKDNKRNGEGLNFLENGKIQEGIFKDNKFIYAQKIKKIENKFAKVSNPNTLSKELDTLKREAESEKQRRIELERKLAVLENKQKQEQQRIDTDTRAPLLEIISNKTRGKRGTIRGIAKDNVEVAEVTVDGKPINISSTGNFEYSTYVPSQGVELKLQVTDVSGLTTSKVVSLKGNLELANPSISFDRLNPISKKVKSNPKALALIVGVSNYENTKAKALYADNDAMVFKDYATEKLGISENRIKILLNDGADERDILLTVREWLRRSAKPNQSDIYVFFAGHGLASDNGKDMYLLPHDGSPRLLEKTAILRDELFSDIKESNPKSVTVFLDTCYSGVTRNEEMLIAGRPIVIKAKEQAIPDGFTLFSAASNEQISRPLEEAKHGMFSYFLMKGMEGDADANADNKITARELHIYVKQNVVQQSSGSQTPELQGDKYRVLVQFN